MARSGFRTQAPKSGTLVIATNLQMKAMLAADKVDSGLVKLLKRVDTSKTAVAVLDFKAVRPLVTLGMQNIPPLSEQYREFLELPKLVEWVEVTLDVQDGIDLAVSVGAADDQGAERLEAARYRAAEGGELVPGTYRLSGEQLSIYRRRIPALSADRGGTLGVVELDGGRVIGLTSGGAPVRELALDPLLLAEALPQLGAVERDPVRGDVVRAGDGLGVPVDVLERVEGELGGGGEEAFGGAPPLPVALLQDGCGGFARGGRHGGRLLGRSGGVCRDRRRY